MGRGVAVRAAAAIARLRGGSLGDLDGLVGGVWRNPGNIVGLW